MKYLKTFENIDTKDYYEIIDSDNPWEDLYDKHDPQDFEDRNIKILTDLFNNKLNLKRKTISIDTTRIDKRSVRKFDVDIKDSKTLAPETTIFIEMIQYEDEYFGVLISFPDKEYEPFAKCDQIGGVIRFLQDYKIIKKD